MCRKHRPADAHLVPEVFSHVRTRRRFEGCGSFPRNPAMLRGVRPGTGCRLCDVFPDPRLSSAQLRRARLVVGLGGTLAWHVVGI